MLADDIKKNLIEHYETLLSKGALMAINQINRVNNASDIELIELAEKGSILRRHKITTMS